MDYLSVKNVSSLEKIFLSKTCVAEEINAGSALVGEEFCYQIAFISDKECGADWPMELKVDSDIKDCITLYNVRNVPVTVNHFYGAGDDNYISHELGLFPDMLEPYTDCVMASPHHYLAVWVSVKVDDIERAGKHDIKISFIREGEVWGESNFSLDVVGCRLPKPDICNTNWFHCDCIASYYNVRPLSEKHWRLIDNYMKTAVEHGVNMILTPIFTPPLDTKVGLERPTVQLVEVSFENGIYSFGFDKLVRWMEMCKQNGIKYLEISHLYSQWGAEHTPKIVVKENGKKIKKFGWKTEALSEEYKDFIRQLLPPLKEVLAENWDKENVYFHISDEPAETYIEHYGEIYKFIKPLLGEFKQMDAISDYEIFSKGYIETPVVVTSSIKQFIDNNVENLWTYYCCGPDNDNYSNRFIAMPSFRNRILGVQLYKYGIKGFLHWGYNFYYSRLSTHPINPYVTTDAEGGFPAGDSFVVYPGRTGEAYPSLRLKVFFNALQDMMAAKLLESLTGKEEVLKIIEEDCEIDFNHYPHDAKYILTVREKINSKIKELIG